MEYAAVEEIGMTVEEVEGYREVFFWFDEEMTGLLGYSDIRRLLQALELPITSKEAQVLQGMIAEGKEGGSDDDRSSCNFVEFLLLMKKLMERNFCGISQKVEA